MENKTLDKEILKLSYEDFQNLGKHVTIWNRINSCQAWFGAISLDGSLYYIVLSYNTIVAIYSPNTGVLYSVGRFSMTTYQHIRKYKNNYTPNKYNTKEINLELCNWFK